MGKFGLGLSYSAATKSLDDIKSVSEDNDVVVVAKTSGMTVMTINDLSFENSDEAVITLSKDNNFAEVINDIKAYASPDTPYYYTIVEYMINGQKVDAAGYVDSYKVTDGDSETHYSINAASGGNASVEITNTKKPTESVGLPRNGRQRNSSVYRSRNCNNGTLRYSPLLQAPKPPRAETRMRYNSKDQSRGGKAPLRPRSPRINE